MSPCCLAPYPAPFFHRTLWTLSQICRGIAVFPLVNFRFSNISPVVGCTYSPIYCIFWNIINAKFPSFTFTPCKERYFDMSFQSFLSSFISKALYIYGILSVSSIPLAVPLSHTGAFIVAGYIPRLRDTIFFSFFCLDSASLYPFASAIALFIILSLVVLSHIVPS